MFASVSSHQRSQDSIALEKPPYPSAMSSYIGLGAALPKFPAAAVWAKLNFPANVCSVASDAGPAPGSSCANVISLPIRSFGRGEIAITPPQLSRKLIASPEYSRTESALDLFFVSTAESSSLNFAEALRACVAKALGAAIPKSPKYPMRGISRYLQSREAITRDKQL